MKCIKHKQALAKHSTSIGEHYEFHDFYEELKEYLPNPKRNKKYIMIDITNFLRIGKIFSSLNIILKILGLNKKIPNFAIRSYNSLLEDYKAYLKMLEKHKIKFKIEKKFWISLNLMQKYGKRFENNILRAMGPVCKDVFVGPRYILLDLVRKCNTDCVYCRTFSAYLHKSKKSYKNKTEYYGQWLDFDLIKNIVNDAKDIGVDTIPLVGGGEPTLYPHFKELLQLIKKNDLRFNISTNGIILNNFFDELLNNSLNSITVSMSFATEESFKKIRPNTPIKFMKKIEDNVAELCKKIANKKLQSKVIVLHALNTLNYTEIIKMAEKAVLLKPDVLWMQMTHLEPFSYKQLKLNERQLNRIKKDISKAKKICESNNINFASFIDYELDHFKESKGDWSKKALLYDGCFVGWHFSYIRIEEILSFCCGFHHLFNLSKKKRFKELWFSNVYKRYRNDGLIMHKENPINMLGGTMYNKFCKSCDNHDQNNYMRGLIKDYKFTKFVER